MEIIWTKLAKITYVEILENIKVRWTFKEMKAFNDLTNEIILKIKQNDIQFPNPNSQLGIKKAIIHKTVSVYFKQENEKVYLITFFNNRMNPETLKELLKN